MKQVSISIKGNYQRNEPHVKRLSDTEFRARLDKGLCFRCNEKYSPGHRCKVKEKRELVLFILNEEESVEEGNPSEESTEEIVELKQLDILEEREIELKTITGLTSKGTMKLRGKIEGKEVIVLIDSGATHNFIHEALVEEKQLKITQGTKFGVTIGNGTRCLGKGICKRVKLKLRELTILADFLAVELGRVDVVLGMQWLDTTGTMKIHWPTPHYVVYGRRKANNFKGGSFTHQGSVFLKNAGENLGSRRPRIPFGTAKL